MLYTLSGVPKEAFDRNSHAAQHGGVRAHVRGRRHRALGRHHAGPALRPQRAASGHAEGPSAGAQLSGRAGHLAHRRSARRPVLRPSASRASSPSARERIVTGIAAQAAIAIDNARLYQAAQDRDRRAHEGAGRAARSERNAGAPRDRNRRGPRPFMGTERGSVRSRRASRARCCVSSPSWTTVLGFDSQRLHVAFVCRSRSSRRCARRHRRTRRSCAERPAGALRMPL